MEEKLSLSLGREALQEVRKRHVALAQRYRVVMSQHDRRRAAADAGGGTMVDAAPAPEASPSESGDDRPEISGGDGLAFTGAVTGIPVEATTLEDLLPDIEELLTRIERSGKLWCGPEERYEAESLLDYWQAALLRGIGSARDTRLEPFEPAPDSSRAPYKRLEAFDEEDADLFFGREPLVEAAVRRLRSSHFVALIGQSGSGKSSLLRAGVIPAVRQGKLGDDRVYRMVVVVPGAEPLRALARAAADAGTARADKNEETIRAFRGSENHLARVLAEAGPLLLAIDQFEEVFTRGGVDADAFVRNLLSLLEDEERKHCVAITMRTEFESRCAAFEGLHSLVNENAVRVGALSATELREAIELPAASMGVKFEPGLVSDLVNEVLGEANGLPLLQFALWKLWEMREPRDGSFVIPRRAYRDLQGARHALASAAERFYVDNPARQTWVERVLLGIVRFGGEGETVNNRIPRARLYEGWNETDRPAVDGAVDGLVREGLLRITPGGEAEGPLVELAHEALARSWKRLAEWVQDSRDAIFLIRKLEDRVGRWLPDRDPRNLLSRGDLDQWDELHEKGKLRPLGCEPRVRELVDASRKHLHQGEARKTTIRRLYVALGVLLVGLILGVEHTLEAGQAAQSLAYISARYGAEALSDQKVDEAVLLGLAAAQSELDAKQGHAAKRLVMNVLGDHPALLTYLHPGGDRIFAVAYRPDRLGHVLVTADRNGLVTLWDLSGEVSRPHPLPVPGEPGMLRVAFNRDGTRLAYGQRGGGLAVFNTSDPQAPTESVEGVPTKDRILSVAFVAGGAKLSYVESHDNLVQWDLKKHREVSRRKLDGWVCVGFSPDGDRVAVGQFDRSLVVYSLPDGRRRVLGHDASTTSVEFSPDGRRLAAGNLDGDIQVWTQPSNHAAAWDSSKRWHAHEGAVYSLSFRDEGGALASAGGDGAVGVWAATGEPLAPLLKGHADDVNAVAWSPDGRSIASGGDDGEVILWDTHRLRPLRGFDTAVRRVAFRDASTVVGMDRGGNAAFWSPGRSREYAPRPTWRRRFGTAKPANSTIAPFYNLTADGSQVIEYRPQADGQVRCRFLDPKTDGIIGFERNCAPNSVVRATADGRTVAVYTTRGSKGEIQVAGGRSTNWGPAASCPDLGTDATMAIAPRGSMIALAGQAGGVGLWRCDAAGTDAPTVLSVELVPKPNKVFCLEFSGDGKLAAGSTDAKIWVWDTATGKGVELSGSPRGRITALAFSRDGQLLASGGRDGHVLLWSLGAEPAIPWPVQAHKRPISSLAFSPDGRQVASGAEDGTVVLLQGTPRSWAEVEWRACATANRNLTKEEWKEFLSPIPRRKQCPDCP